METEINTRQGEPQIDDTTTNPVNLTEGQTGEQTITLPTVADSPTVSPDDTSVKSILTGILDEFRNVYTSVNRGVDRASEWVSGVVLNGAVKPSTVRKWTGRISLLLLLAAGVTAKDRYDDRKVLEAQLAVGQIDRITTLGSTEFNTDVRLKAYSQVLMDEPLDQVDELIYKTDNQELVIIKIKNGRRLHIYNQNTGESVRVEITTNSNNLETEFEVRVIAGNDSIIATYNSTDPKQVSNIFAQAGLRLNGEELEKATFNSHTTGTKGLIEPLLKGATQIVADVKKEKDAENIKFLDSLIKTPTNPQQEQEQEATPQNETGQPTTEALVNNDYPIFLKFEEYIDRLMTTQVTKNTDDQKPYTDGLFEVTVTIGNDGEKIFTVVNNAADTQTEPLTITIIKITDGDEGKTTLSATVSLGDATVGNYLATAGDRVGVEPTIHILSDEEDATTVFDGLATISNILHDAK